MINNLSTYWQEKEREWGRKITVNEVAKGARLDWETVNNLKKGATTRYDAHVIGQVCEFFGVAEGSLIPFFTFHDVKKGQK